MSAGIVTYYDFLQEYVYWHVPLLKIASKCWLCTFSICKAMADKIGNNCSVICKNCSSEIMACGLVEHI